MIEVFVFIESNVYRAYHVTLTLKLLPLQVSSRVIGDKIGEQEVRIPFSTGTGAWKNHSFTDELGEESDKVFHTCRHGDF